MYFFKTVLLNSHPVIRQTQYIEKMTKVGPTKTVSFVTLAAIFPGLVHGQTSHVVNIHHSFNSFFYTSRQRRDKLFIVMMSKEGSTKVMKFMTQRARILAYFFKNLLYYRAQVRQIMFIVMVTKKGSIKICSNMNVRVALGSGHFDKCEMLKCGNI